MNIVGFSAGIAEGSFNETASDAYWSECWTKLNALLGESNVEPAFAAQTYTAFVAEESSYYTLVKQVIDSEIITVPPSPDILALNSAYVAAFQALATYLNAGSTWSSGVPSWISDANLSATDTIVGATFRGTWKAYYDARTALLNAIAAKSKIIADLAQDAAGSVALRVDTTLDANNRVTTAVIPTTSIAPDRAGLFMGANYMGFHDGDEWKTYMDANGNFALDGAGAHGLSWNAATGTLTVAGNITVQDGAITSDKLTSSQIVGKDIRTAANVGNGTVSGCRMTTAGFEAYNGATRTVFISNTGAASFAGTVTCGSGSKIAGFTATTTDMTAGSGSTAIGLSTDTDKKAFWAGHATPASAPFYIEHDGTVKMKDGLLGQYSFDITTYNVGGNVYDMTTIGKAVYGDKNTAKAVALAGGFSLPDDQNATALSIAHGGVTTTGGGFLAPAIYLKSSVNGVLRSLGLHAPIKPVTTSDEESYLASYNTPIYVALNSTTEYAMHTEGRINAKGGYTSVSDERVKSDIADVSVLESLKTVRVKKYRLDDAKSRRVLREARIEASLRDTNGFELPKPGEFDQPDLPEYNPNLSIGAMAADFNAAFGLNRGSASVVCLNDQIGVALRAIQELAEIVDDQAAEIAELRAALKLPEKQKKQVAAEFADEEIEKVADAHIKAAYENIMQEYKKK